MDSNMYCPCIPPSRSEDKLWVGTVSMKAIREEKKQSHELSGVWLGQGHLKCVCQFLSAQWYVTLSQDLVRRSRSSQTLTASHISYKTPTMKMASP